MSQSAEPKVPVLRYALWALLVVGLVGAMVASFLSHSTGTKAERLPIFAELPGFILTDQDGREVRLDDLLGEPWVATFIYTRCPGPCPKISQKLAELGPKLPSGVRRVSFTVDPEHDDPATLKAYAAKFEGHGGGSWQWLTGPKDGLYELIQDGFKLLVEPTQAASAAEGPLAHSLRFVLVDAEGRVRGYYLALEPEEAAKLLQDAAALADEARKAR
ncbi:MAG TPA: SCO family protein [Thermoanaerobaculia bacterium]|nr:SCO family protein [Thermoanaerobaculia bacterium]